MTTTRFDRLIADTREMLAAYDAEARPDEHLPHCAKEIEQPTTRDVECTCGLTALRESVRRYDEAKAKDQR